MNEKEIKERVIAIFEEVKRTGKAHNKRGFLGPLGLKDSYINGILNPEAKQQFNLPKKYYEAFIKHWNVNPEYFYFGTLPMFKEDDKKSESNVKHLPTPSVQSNATLIGEIFPGEEETNFRDLGNGNLLMLVPEVDIFSMAGYAERIQDREWVAELPTVEMIVEKHARGRYLAFNIIGESMTDGSEHSIPHGAVVIGREIKREAWYPKFHTHKWDEFIIVMKNRTMVKAIKDQDFENGTITLSSYNPDKAKYADEIVNIDEILEVFNVIEVRVKRRR